MEQPPETAPFTDEEQPQQQSDDLLKANPYDNTVANSTTNRLHAFGFEVTGGSGPAACLEGTGPSLGSAVGPQSIVYAGDAGDDFACGPLTPGSMTGSIALVSRGGCSSTG